VACGHEERTCRLTWTHKSPNLFKPLAERIDPNELLNRVDVNAQLDRVDVNRLMQRVDVDELVRRSNLASIIAESSGGVFAGILDSLRIEIVDVDLGFLRLFQCNKKILPPAPGKVYTHTPFPDTKMEKAIAVQEHYCNLFSKGLALMIDWLLMMAIFALISVAMQAAYVRIDQLFIKSNQEAQKLAQADDLWVSICTLVAWYLYFWILVALPGQTIGMGIAGVRVVQVNGNKNVSWGRAAVRTAAMWVVIFCWPVTIWVGIFRRDGRMPHDILACTGMIYKWNAGLANAREKSKERAEAMGEDKAELNP